MDGSNLKASKQSVFYFKGPQTNLVMMMMLMMIVTHIIVSISIVTYFIVNST